MHAHALARPRLFRVAGLRGGSAAVALAALVAALVSGCASPASVREDLLQASTDATAAVHSGQMALGLLDAGRTTRQHAETIFVDMTRELTSAETMVTQLTLSDPAQILERDQVLEAVHSGSLAILTGRDCLQTRSSCELAADRLAAADRQLLAVEQQLRGRR